MNKEHCSLIREKEMPFSRTTMWKLRTSGKIPFYRIGRRIYYSSNHLELLLQACEIGRGKANEQH